MSDAVQGVSYPLEVISRVAYEPTVIPQASMTGTLVVTGVIEYIETIDAVDASALAPRRYYFFSL